MIRLENVGIAVGRRTIVRSASGVIPAGSVTHLTGANGSGKTSLIRAIAGLQRFTGSIEVEQRPPADDRSRSSRPRPPIYVCFDDAPVLPFLNGYENVRFLLGRQLGKRQMARFAPALADHALLRIRASRLSQGQRRRLHLLAALLSDASCLVFDEALNGIDAPTVEEVAEALQRTAPDAAVLITGHHDDAFARLATRRLELNFGELVEVVYPCS